MEFPKLGKVKKPYVDKKSLLDKKISMAALVFIAIVATILRTQQLNTNMDYATGKYITEGIANNYTSVILWLGFALIAFIIFAGTAKDKVIDDCVMLNPYNLSYDKLNPKMPHMAAYAMMFTALAVVVDIYVQLSNVISTNIEENKAAKELMLEFEFQESIFRGIPALKWVVYFFMIIMIINLFTAAANILKGEGISKNNCFFFIFYPFWKLFDIFVMMNSNGIIGAYSERVYFLMYAIIASIFVLLLIRFFTGHEKKHTRPLLVIFGCFTGIMACVSVIPRFLMFFVAAINGDGRQEYMTFPDITDLGMGLIAIFVICVFWTKFEYRPAPKSNIVNASRKWMAQSALTDMESLDPNAKADLSQGKFREDVEDEEE